MNFWTWKIIITKYKFKCYLINNLTWYFSLLDSNFSDIHVFLFFSSNIFLYLSVAYFIFSVFFFFWKRTHTIFLAVLYCWNHRGLIKTSFTLLKAFWSYKPSSVELEWCINLVHSASFHYQRKVKKCSGDDVYDIYDQKAFYKVKHFLFHLYDWWWVY